jgi:hypothetical protein
MMQITQEGTNVVVRLCATGESAINKTTATNKTFPDIGYDLNITDNYNLELYKLAFENTVCLSDAEFVAFYDTVRNAHVAYGI